MDNNDLSELYMHDALKTRKQLVILSTESCGRYQFKLKGDT